MAGKYPGDGSPALSSALYDGGNAMGQAISGGTADNNAFTIKTNSVAAISIDTSQNVTIAGSLTVTGATIFTGVLEAPLGTVLLPSFTFAADVTSGLFMPAGLHEVAVTANAVQQCSWTGGQYFAVGGATANAPHFSFSGNGGLGIYRVSADVLGFATGGALRGKADGANWTLGAATPAASSQHNMNAQLVVQSASLAAATVGYTATNTDNTSGTSQARLYMESGGSSGGDAFALFSVLATTQWAVGLDNSDSDSFKVSQSTLVGTNDFLTITTTGNVVIGNAQLAQGATAGFFFLPTCATGAPNGTPAAIPTGRVPMVYDVTNHKIAVYDGGAWKETAALT